jgi:hypothetical protein
MKAGCSLMHYGASRLLQMVSYVLAMLLLVNAPAGIDTASGSHSNTAVPLLTICENVVRLCYHLHSHKQQLNVKALASRCCSNHKGATTCTALAIAMTRSHLETRCCCFLFSHAGAGMPAEHSS